MATVTPIRTKPLRLVLHFHNQLLGWSGGQNYLRALIELLNRLPRAEWPELYLFDDEPGGWAADMTVQWALPVVSVVLGPGGEVLHASTPALRASLEAVAPAQRRRIVAGEADALYPMLPGCPYPVNSRHWLWVPDFQHRHLPHFFDAEELVQRERRTLDLLARPCPLLLSSHSALDDLRRFYPDHAARPRVWSFRGLAVPQPPERLREVRARYALPGRYLFIANQFWGHKDHATAFRALALLRDRGVEIDLICTGAQEDHRDPGYYGRLFALAAELGLTRIRHLGMIAHADVLACLQMATCVLQPSHFEGWSTLVEDAVALGTPILASHLPVHVEQLGAGNRFFAPGDAQALADLLAATLPDLPDASPPERVRTAAEAYERLRLTAAQALMNLVASS
jgi:glycosyltransferase involved in cell wall biosynthesis